MTGQTLTARSAIASTLLGVSPPELPTRSLVATAELMGIAGGTARVAMSRMVAAGELEATETGYRLVSLPLLARQSRQALSREGITTEWDGTWRTAIVNSEGRPAPERAELRAVMASLRYGELREGVWLRPANLPGNPAPEARALVAERCTLLDSRPDQPVALAGRLWDLPAWSARTKVLSGDLDRLGARLNLHDHTALAEGFTVSAAVLRQLQADPLLPAEILPASWPGDRLRAQHRTYDQAFKTALTAWLRTRQDHRS